MNTDPLSCRRPRRTATARLRGGIRPAWLALLATAWLAMLAATAARGGEIRVSDQRGLLEALAGARGGETILLAPGEYGALLLLAHRLPFSIDYPAPVTIASADRTRPAVFSGAHMRGGRNFVFDGLRFDYRFAPGDKIHKRPFDFWDSTDLVIRNSVFAGDVARGVSPEDDGFGWAFGLSLRGSLRARIEHNEIHGFFRGLVMGRTVNGVVRGNEIHSLRMDGMNFSRSSGILIEGNLIRDFRRSPSRKDHADMIQFWTANADTPSTDITIRGNVLLSGRGGNTQSIFMRNEMVDRGRAGREMFYRNVTIEENVIVNGHLHGITLGESDGVVIRNNTLLRNPAAARGEDLERRVRIPRIRLAADSRNVTIEGNIAGALPEAGPGWRLHDNLVVQDISPARPGHYNRLFRDALRGDPRRLESYEYLAGGAADRPGLGSALLRPGARQPQFGPRGRRRRYQTLPRNADSRRRAGSAIAEPAGQLRERRWR